MLKRVLVLLAALAALLTVTALAEAELTASGNLFIRFDGGISPRSLPRSTLAPIAVRVEGTIRVPSGEDPPALRAIRVAVNREGHLRTRGLPICRRSQISTADPAEALGACGRGLVGSGGFRGTTAFKGQSAQDRVSGQILLFNSLAHGHSAILAHVFQVEPVPTTRLLVFEIRRTPGTFGTVLHANLPASLSQNGHLTSIFLQLHRHYTFHGQPRDYLSARCAAPVGFPGATFAFARTSMSFADGRTLSSTLTRSCRVAPTGG